MRCCARWAPRSTISRPGRPGTCSREPRCARTTRRPLYEFTQHINRQLDHEQKAHVVELLWQVAYADGDLDKYEEHLVRRIADLIHVPALGVHPDEAQGRKRGLASLSRAGAHSLVKVMSP